MSRRRTLLCFNALMLAGAVALYGCGSSDSDSEPDGGAANGGQGAGAGEGGSGAGGNNDGGTTNQAGGGGAGGLGTSPDAGAGSGGSGMNQGGSAPGPGGQGGQSSMDAGTRPPMCETGGTCTAGQMCEQACAGNRVRPCSCVGERLFCGRCEEGPDGGGDPSACPANPQASACDPEARPFCSYTAGQRSGNCACVGDKLYCPNLPAPEGAAACPTSPAGKPCTERGAFCQSGTTRSCVCSRFGNNDGAPTIWLCGA